MKKHWKKFWIAALLAAAVGGGLAACGEDSVDFHSFVEGLLEETADDTEPVEVNGISFTFSEDETVFSDVVTP
ncbi:MAG: hypothetical protein AB1405_02655 [Bdellovibrionota bacterium]